MKTCALPASFSHLPLVSATAGTIRMLIPSGMSGNGIVWLPVALSGLTGQEGAMFLPLGVPRFHQATDQRTKPLMEKVDPAPALGVSSESKGAREEREGLRKQTTGKGVFTPPAQIPVVGKSQPDPNQATGLEITFGSARDLPGVATTSRLVCWKGQPTGPGIEEPGETRWVSITGTRPAYKRPHSPSREDTEYQRQVCHKPIYQLHGLRKPCTFPGSMEQATYTKGS